MKFTPLAYFILYSLTSHYTEQALKNLVNTPCFSKIRINLDEPCKEIKLMKKCQYNTCVVPRFDYSEEKNICKVGKPKNNKCEDDNDEKDAIGVDLKQADQTYSGYKDGASEIWNKIYNSSDGYPLITKLISGIHFSITVHISVYYKFVVKEYMCNPLLYFQKFKSEYYENLKFTLNFVRYAVGSLDKDHYKCSLMLSSHEMGLIGNVIEHARKTSGPSIRLMHYNNVFDRISELLNCIECDKCKLWGKIQFNGLKVAMDIISGKKKHLGGNELVYIIQLSNKLENSVYFAKELQQKIKYRYVYLLFLYYIEILTIIISMTLFFVVNRICLYRNNLNKNN